MLREPDSRSARRFLLAMSLVLYSLALVDFMSDTEPRHSARWSWLFNFFHGWFGQSGSIFLYVLLGTFLLLLAIFQKR